MEDHLRGVAASAGWKKVATHSGELTDRACAALDLPWMTTDADYDVRELESCDAGISQCEALIAQTGSVLVSSRSSGGRALSVLPPHHVVLARREQLLPDLPTAFALLQSKYQSRLSQLNFIHHRPEPDRRYRANPRSRRAWSEEANHPLCLERAGTAKTSDCLSRSCDLRSLEQTRPWPSNIGVWADMEFG